MSPPKVPDGELPLDDAMNPKEPSQAELDEDMAENPDDSEEHSQEGGGGGP